MERDLLENIKIGGTPLPGEVIDLILQEAERDVSTAVEKYSDYDSIKEQLEAAQTAIKDFEGQDIEGVRNRVKELEAQLSETVKAHEAERAEAAFMGKVTAAVRKAGGRNEKAVCSLLDLDALRKSKNQDADIEAAIKAAQESDGYMFGGETPPPYSAGAGSEKMSGGTVDGVEAAFSKLNPGLKF